MDRGLVARARQGDREAFSSLAVESTKRLYPIAVLILRDASRAEDAVQDALLAAWRDLRALRDVDAFEAWLNRLTVRACYKLARKERGQVVNLRVVALGRGEYVSDHATAIVDRDVIERALRRAGVEQRAVLVLHFYAGLSLPQVAEVLGVPVGTAKSRLHRGLELLRHELEQDVKPAANSGERMA